MLCKRKGALSVQRNEKTNSIIVSIYIGRPISIIMRELINQKVGSEYVWCGTSERIENLTFFLIAVTRDSSRSYITQINN
jgi:hypothetical protein